MGKLKKITDERYISRFFRNIARQKEITVSILYREKQVDGLMFFNSRRGIEPNIRTQDMVLEFQVGETMDITFYNSEVLFLFQTEITTIFKNTCTVKTPNILFYSFRRLMSRYTIKEDEGVFLKFNQDTRHRVTDISSTGLSFISDRNSYSVSQVVRDVSVSFKNHPNVYIDGVIKNVRNKADGSYIFGMCFSNLDLNAHNLIFSNTFDKIYPKLKMLDDVSVQEIMNIYEKSGYLNVLYKNNNNVSEYFQAYYPNFSLIRSRNMISSGLVYYKSERFLAMGLLFRVYNRTFAGHQVISLPETKMDPKPVNEVQSGLCDFMINHPYFKYYVTYLYTDLTRTMDYYRSIENIINDSDKFYVDSLQCLECKCSEYIKEGEPECCESTVLDDPKEFIEFCEKNLTSLERMGYSYTKKEFDLSEIRQILDTIGIHLYRRVWRIADHGRTVAYAVAETCSDCVNLLNPTDVCRIYFASESFDLKMILKTLMPSVIRFYEKYDKKYFNVFLKVWKQVARDIKMPGLEYVCPVGRVISDKKGMIEYKKHLNGEIISSPRLYNLTHPQLAIWYSEKVYPDTNFANIAGLIRIEENVDRKILDRAINLVIQSNDGLRVRLTDVEKNPRQYVSRYKYKSIDFFDFSSHGGEKGLYNWDEYKNRTAFKLADSDLFYFAIFKISDDEGGFYIKTHHIISDAWTSSNLLISKIMEYYSFFKHSKITRKRMPSYIDYILSEEEYKNSKRFLEQREFWKSKFETIPELMSLNPISSALKNTDANRKTYTMSEELTCKVNKFCKNTGNSPFTVFMAILSIYMSKITSKRDIVIATPVLNRSNAREKETVGMFVSAVPVRLNLLTDSSFNDFMAYINNEWKHILKNQKFPYDIILNDFREKHKINENLYDTVISYQNTSHRKFDADYNVDWVFNGQQTDTLVIHISDREGQGSYTIDYDYLLCAYSGEDIELMNEYMTNLLEDAISYPNKKLSQLEIITEKAKNKLINCFNNTDRLYPEQLTISELFMKQAAKTPYNTAVVCSGSKLTYKDLDKRSNQLAQILIEKGIKPNSIIGILINRSFNMVIAIMAVLKAGGAYLPIDPEYPDDRIKYILEDSKAEMLLVDSSAKQKIDSSREYICLDEVVFSSEYTFNPILKAKPDNAAYIIYTSGSTGKPKGVIVSIKSLVNLCMWYKKEYFIDEESRVLLVIPFGFDASIKNIITPLISGGQLILAPSGYYDAEKVLELIENSKVNLINCVPSAIYPIVDFAEKDGFKKLSSVRFLLLGGEAMILHKLSKWFASKECRCVLGNIYGPTECTDISTYFNISKEEAYSRKSIPIGKPIDNCKVYIMNEENRLVPIGVTGELCISGKGVAIGYVNNPELTAERFLPNPFLPGEKIYKTGDLAKWLSDGNIEYAGRKDHQVKIRGYRIELGEVENCLLQHSSIKDTVVVDCMDHSNSKYICAYIVSDRILPEIELREHLLQELPDYMVPLHFVRIERIPLTSNGKVDRKALPEPENKDCQKKKLLLPVNETETKLAEMWQELLNLKKVSMDDNFFEMGGDSIKAIQLSAGMQKYNMKLEIQDIFKHPTVRGMGKQIKSYSQIISQDAVEGEVYLTPIQKAFFERGHAYINHFNQSFMIFRKEGFITELVRKIFMEIVNHHDAFRMIFRIKNTEVTQINRSMKGDLFGLSVQELHNEQDYVERIQIEADLLQQKISLTDGPLIQLGLFKTTEGDHLLIIVHHLVIDGVSWRILLEDFNNAYQSCMKKNEISFPPKTNSFKYWAEKLNAYSRESELLRQKDYWKCVEETQVPLLPKDLLTETNFMMDSAQIDISLSTSETEDLLKHANKVYGTEINDILLTAFGLALKDMTCHNKFVINMEGHGREELINGIDITRTIGWFTSVYPVILDMSKNDDLSSQIKHMKESLRHIPNKGSGYGILRYLTHQDMKKNFEFKLQPEILFNYLGSFDQMANTETFCSSPIYEGNAVSPYSIRQYVFEVNGMVINEKLEFSLSYNKLQYFEPTVANLMDSFKAHLKDIINHCINKDRIELTPADFGDDNLTIEELEEISDIILEL